MSQQNSYPQPASLCSPDENIEESFVPPHIPSNPIEITGQDGLYAVSTYTSEGQCDISRAMSGYSDIDLVGVGSHMQVDPHGYVLLRDYEIDTSLLETYLDVEESWGFNFGSLGPMYPYGDFTHPISCLQYSSLAACSNILSESPNEHSASLHQQRQDAVEIKSAVGSSSSIQTVNGSLYAPTAQSVLPLECSISGCLKTFKKRSELNKHKKTHLGKSDRPHSCSSCPVTFLYSKDLERHNRSKHADLGTVTDRYLCTVSGCKFASKGFARKDKKNQHMNTHEKKCPSTSRSASQRGPGPNSLTNKKAHPCTYKNCPRPEGFDTLHDLLRHQRSVHGRLDKAYRCMSDGCKKQDKVWSRLDNFRVHVLKMHSNEDLEALIKRSENWDTDISQPRPFVAGSSASPLIMAFHSRVPQKHCVEDFTRSNTERT